MKGETLTAVATEHRRAAVERARRAAIRGAAAASSTAAAAAVQGIPHSQVAAEVAAEAPGQPVPAAEEVEAAARAAPPAAGLGGRRHSRVRFDLPEPALEEAGQAAVAHVMLPPAPAGTAAGPSGTPLNGGSSLAGGGGQPSTRLPGVQYVPLTEAEVLQQLDQQKLWHSSQALARHVLAELRWAIIEHMTCAAVHAAAARCGSRADSVCIIVSFGRRPAPAPSHVKYPPTSCTFLQAAAARCGAAAPGAPSAVAAAQPRPAHTGHAAQHAQQRRQQRCSLWRRWQ